MGSSKQSILSNQLFPEAFVPSAQDLPEPGGLLLLKPGARPAARCPPGPRGLRPPEWHRLTCSCYYPEPRGPCIIPQERERDGGREGEAVGRRKGSLYFWALLLRAALRAGNRLGQHRLCTLTACRGEDSKARLESSALPPAALTQGLEGLSKFKHSPAFVSGGGIAKRDQYSRLINTEVG